MVILKKILLFAGLFLLVGCTSSARLVLTSNLPQTQTNYQKIPVYFQSPPRRSRPLALLAVSRDGENAVWAVEILKMEAARLGADALAQVEVSYSTFFFPSLRVQGLAIKYVD